MHHSPSPGCARRSPRLPTCARSEPYPDLVSGHGDAESAAFGAFYGTFHIDMNTHLDLGPAGQHAGRRLNPPSPNDD